MRGHATANALQHVDLVALSDGRMQVIPSPLRTMAFSLDSCIAGLLSVASTPLVRSQLGDGVVMPDDFELGF